jgi:hypothetical protein
LWRELARLFDHRSDWAAALPAAEKYLERSPEQIDPYVLKATLLEKASRSDEAQRVLRDLLKRSTGRRWAVVAQELARLQLLLGKVEEARGLLEQVHAQQPDDLMAISTLANVAWITADWQALKRYETWLLEVEGSAGTLWRFFRAQRLLEEAISTDDQKFEEVWRISQTLQDSRPRWSKTKLLQGDIALRSGQIDPAIASFQRAWHLGDRSALLADRLIDLLTRRDRIEEAKSYVSQVQSSLSLSSRLFDRAIPYFTAEDEQLQALQLAEAWVARQPNSAAAHERLGRVLWLMSENDENGRTPYRQQAMEAFQQALRLAPSNVAVWIANVEFAQDQNDSRESLEQIVENLAQLVQQDPFSHALVTAQLYEQLDHTLLAQRSYQRALQQPHRLDHPSAQLELLTRTCEFYQDRVPILAEFYAREALRIDADAMVAQRLLMRSLADSNDPEKVTEALALLSQTGLAGHPGSVDAQRRMRARLLARQGGSARVGEAIGLLETLLQKTDEDKRDLATLYEQSGRVGPAFDILSQLASANTEQMRDPVAFLNFWQNHFLAKQGATQQPQFLALATGVHDQLGRRVEHQPEWLRWKLRALKTREPAQPIAGQQVNSMVSEIVTRNLQAGNWSRNERRAWFRSLLTVLLREATPQQSVELAQQPPAQLTEVEAAIALCHAMILTQSATEARQQVNQFLQAALAKHSQRADLARAVGDYQLMSGQYAFAVDAYLQSLQVGPNHKLTSNNLALALVELPGQLQRADEILQVALQEHGADPMLLDTRAMLQLIDGRPKEAFATLQQILIQRPEDATVRTHLAMAYHALGQAELSRIALVEAMCLGVDESLLSPRDRAFFRERSLPQWILPASYDIPTPTSSETITAEMQSS